MRMTAAKNYSHGFWPYITVESVTLFKAIYIYIYISLYACKLAVLRLFYDLKITTTWVNFVRLLNLFFSLKKGIAMMNNCRVLFINKQIEVVTLEQQHCPMVAIKYNKYFLSSQFGGIYQNGHQALVERQSSQDDLSSLSADVSYILRPSSSSLPAIQLLRAAVISTEIAIYDPLLGPCLCKLI